MLRRPCTAAAAIDFIHAVHAAPGLTMLVPGSRRLEWLREVSDRPPAPVSNIWHEVDTAALMLEHGVRCICTRAADFHRFPFLEPLDPPVGAP